MKYFIIIALFFVSANGLAQETRLNVYLNYAFDDSFNSYYSSREYYDGKIKGSAQWGGGIEFLPAPHTGIELLYLRMDTHAPTYFRSLNTSVEYVDFDLGINYILAGGNQYFRRVGSPLEGFFGLLGGIAIINVKDPSTGSSSNGTKFAWGARLGGTYWLSTRAGFRLQAQLISSPQAIGGGLYFSGYGPQVGLNTYSSFVQFSLGGGLVFRLN
ncbi:hypothetical protein [Robertkochia solimangrovi]|uniref:hypothetical protein n=1 Tax=Robertkochia solimangrovi TaxID=2213046 RepID=UPI00117F1028|nr:hypothetical protein [Robertkochia solimangrovi]TRZ45744.1 hypothetical protein DMZ48_00230 [Robertkochia solimangrovi]